MPTFIQIHKGRINLSRERHSTRAKAEGLETGPDLSRTRFAHDFSQIPSSSLDPAARSFMEARFGCNFADVRVHADSTAATAAAKTLGASAFTVGSHIFFGPGEYAPQTMEGGRLLAHELAHVAQQQGRVPDTARLGHADDAAEAEADVAARTAVLGGRVAPIVSSRMGMVQRSPQIGPAKVTARQALTEEVKDIYGAPGSMDATAWKTKTEAAHKQQNTDLFQVLYAEIATLAQVDKLGPDFGSQKQDIHVGLDGVVGEKNLKPGLNFSLVHMSSNGSTGYIGSDGVFKGAQLPVEQDATALRVAIVIGPTAFSSLSKVQALITLRHEMMHAEHDLMTLKWLAKWQKDRKGSRSRGAGGSSFSEWAGQQKASKVDQALMKANAEKRMANTELLAYVEGFMTGFHLEPAPHAIAFLELRTAGEKWQNADVVVKNEALGRLRHYLGGLGRQYRQEFDTWVLGKLDAATGPVSPDKGKQQTQTALQAITPFLNYLKVLAATP